MRPAKSNLVNAKTEALWQQALNIIRASPSYSSATEFETIAYLLLTLLDYEISPHNITIIYHSAIEGENLKWLIDRLEHQKSKAS